MQVQATDRPLGLCWCGCGERTNNATVTDASSGIVRGRPKRYINGHNRRLSPFEYLEEDRGYDTPCWIWQRSFTRFGYPSHQDGFAHRVYFERRFGPVASGLVLDHLCRVPACVNPEHLEAVTNAENCRRGAKAKITMEIANTIRASPDDALALAARYGISRSTVYNIRKGKRWADV